MEDLLWAISIKFHVRLHSYDSTEFKEEDGEGFVASLLKPAHCDQIVVSRSPLKNGNYLAPSVWN